jgi:hypothetical protein
LVSLPACASRPVRSATVAVLSRTPSSTCRGCRWSSTSARACTGVSRRVGCCSARATPTSSPARPGRSTGRSTSGCASGSATSSR